jgi:phenylalanyl-tRNA synthetase beta chain
MMEFSISALSAFTGLEIPPERALEILEGLEFFPELDGDEIKVSVPPHRVDIERIPDLYEEVIRHVGYDAIPAQLPALPTTPGHRHPNWELIDRAREAAIAAGLAEIMTWSFVDPDTDAKVASQALCPGETVPLVNPLATTQGVMRRSLLPGMLASASANFNQGEREVAVFEEGRVFHLTEDGPVEHERLGVVLSAEKSDREDLFSRLKGIVDDLMGRIGLPTVNWKAGGEPWLDADAGAELVADGGEVVGTVGLLSPEFLEAADLRQQVAVAEIDLDVAEEPSLPRITTLARHPSVVVDTTVEHGADLSFAELEGAAREMADELVEELTFVTQFKPEGDPSVVRTTLRFVYRHAERSLTQDEVNEAHEELRQGLAEELGVDFA